MKILLAASEAVPFCKTGGLADVVGALAQKLGAAGNDVCLYLPRYRAEAIPGLGDAAGQPLAVEQGGVTVQGFLRYAQWRSVSVCLVDHPPYFDRPGLYGENGFDYPDNDRRFAFFSRAALEGARRMGFSPDVVHIHDWQTGLIASYLKGLYAADPLFSGAATVMTVHNMAYQGVFPRSSLEAAGFGADQFRPDRLEYYGKASYLKAGLVDSDLLTTVSPTYAKEIQSADKGFGLEGLLQARRDDLFGVLNGIDLDVWNPETDSVLAKTYSVRSAVAGKAANKRALQKAAGLDESDVPLIGIVSRFDRQKGLDIAIEAVVSRLDRCQVAVLGSGDPALMFAFGALAQTHPRSVHVRQGFDEPFAHLIYAASDIFLMPSRFEPCGLGQMIAMRYGALPVAARTGGLADTVLEPSDGTPGTGFICEPGDAADLGRALERAVACYRQPSWTARVEAVMKADFSWDRSVDRYLELYDRARRLKTLRSK